MTDSTPKQVKFAAFTLIELLVVIAIIVVLMGLLFPVVGAVKESGRKVQAKNDITQIVNAVKAYYTEYGKYPIDTTRVPSTTDAAFGYHPSSGASDNSIVIDVLRNNTTSTNSTNAQTVTTLNPRQIVFLEAPAVKDETAPKSGVTTRGGTVGVWYDPWGSQYSIAMDANYDNHIDRTIHLYSDTNFLTINTGVAAWSYGKDKKQGTNGNNMYTGSDDVISWQ